MHSWLHPWLLCQGSPHSHAVITKIISRDFPGSPVDRKTFFTAKGSGFDSCLRNKDFTCRGVAKNKLKIFLIKKKLSPDMASCFQRDKTEITALDHELFLHGATQRTNVPGNSLSGNTDLVHLCSVYGRGNEGLGK